MRTFAVVAAFTMLIGLGACDDPEPDAAADPGAVDVVDEFDTLDANGDSYLDVDEVAEWADDTGVFEEWDVDLDSELDRDEIDGNAFGLFDGNGDGTISESEWETGTELWYPGDSDLIVFNDVDGDGDSEIDADEFAERFDFSVLGETWTSESLDENTFKQAYFELYDADNDGSVSEQEWNSGSAFFGSPNEA